MVAGGLIVQHYIIGTGDSHEVVASRRRQQQEEIIGRVLVSSRVVGVTDIAAHRQTEELTHEVVFQPGTNDLTFVVQVFRTDKADHTVHQKGLEYARYPVRPRFQSQLIDSIVSFRREGAPLTGFEIHQIVPLPGPITSAVMFEDLLPALLQHRESNAKAAIGSFRASNRLKEQV